ncbi:helix-turn-helix domain-containing protein [Oceanibaculum indicum]|uniref:helix-turn-helix domain-containing protein n=1 Tax=Oceanibaculum indicum TaxID=526216 RepID=UPI003898FF4C
MFKQSIGVPPRVYLTRLRVEKACEFLELTDMPITEIAQEGGIHRTRSSPVCSPSISK